MLGSVYSGLLPSCMADFPIIKPSISHMKNMIPQNVDSGKSCMHPVSYVCRMAKIRAEGHSVAAAVRRTVSGSSRSMVHGLVSGA